MINLPLDSASSIVHLYRSTIASRYNMPLQTLASSDEEDESSTKRFRSNNNKTGMTKAILTMVAHINLKSISVKESSSYLIRTFLF